MEHESLIFKIVMEDGPDLEVLARVSALDIADSAYMGSIAKYPKHNVQLRHGARIIERHDGAPPPPPLVERDPNLKSWCAHLIGGKKMQMLGWVEAVDEAAAIERAVVLFSLDDARRKRLASTCGGSVSEASHPRDSCHNTDQPATCGYLGHWIEAISAKCRSYPKWVMTQSHTAGQHSTLDIFERDAAVPTANGLHIPPARIEPTPPRTKHFRQMPDRSINFMKTNMNYRQWMTMAVTFGIAALVASPVAAQKRYDPGASDSEIRIGNIMPYSGPASAYGEMGKTEAAYFRKVNAEGGVNGRKINFISYDDSYSPPKAVEQARKLVESDEVLLIFNPFGTPSNIAIQKYMNAKKVPQLFVGSGATKFNDPQRFPWTIGFNPSYRSEARIYADYLLKNYPQGKVGVLYQNDDLGKDYLKGLKDGLNGKIRIVAEAPYETSDPTVDSQVINLKASGADVFFNVATPKFAAQAIKKVAELGWKPVHFLAIVSVSVSAVLKPAGFDNAKGVLSADYRKDASDPTWKDDAATKEWLAFMDKYYPDGDKTSAFTGYGYVVAQTLVQVLKQCGDNLTRENVMKQAASLKDLEIDGLLPGIKINTGPNDFAPIKQMQMMRFNGERWEFFGPVMAGDVGG
jgi:ABC-type branched-subunit amino acid transport system substrate-binding protein